MQYINQRERFQIIGKKPNIDKAISKIVGKDILATDERLIKLVRGWKGNKSNDSLKPDNFLEQEDKVAELKKVFS